MLKGSLKVIRGRKKREDYLVAATDHINAGDREMNNGAAIGEKDSSQDNFKGNDVEESKDKFEWVLRNLFHIWSFEANMIYLLEILQIIFCYELPSEQSILFSILDIWIKNIQNYTTLVVLYLHWPTFQKNSFKNKVTLRSLIINL